MAKTPPLHSRIRSALRQVWQWSPERREALSASRISRGNYQCATCRNLFAATQIEIDHIIPVGRTPGARGSDPSDTWDRFVKRLFCAPENLQVLCEPCHKAKTKGVR